MISTTAVIVISDMNRISCAIADDTRHVGPYLDELRVRAKSKKHARHGDLGLWVGITPPLYRTQRYKARWCRALMHFKGLTIIVNSLDKNCQSR